VIISTPRPVFHAGWRPATICRRLGGPQGRSKRLRTSFAPLPGFRYPDRPAHSKSLYRLTYPGPPLNTYGGMFRKVNGEIHALPTTKERQISRWIGGWMDSAARLGSVNKRKISCPLPGVEPLFMRRQPYSLVTTRSLSLISPPSGQYRNR
jgi:hypothetical protein